ncbi:MAG: FAD-dependent thymidylate synthase [Lachnospiraceae bacterium]|nr:FAD-dependent thymidylate synthase [Lachnospiraceae bacterium]
MKITEQSVTIIDPIDKDYIYRKLELIGRVCYKSEDKITEGSAEQFIRRIIKSGHESVLEHQSISVKFIVSRSIANQIVRHRVASYSQESTRYCDYNSGRLGGEITVIRPIDIKPDTLEFDTWEQAAMDAEKAYQNLRYIDVPPEDAREVLPHCLKTELVMTANIREWRHFFRMRCAPAAHKQTRQVAKKLLKQFYGKLPVLFEDEWAEFVGWEGKNEEDDQK